MKENHLSEKAEYRCEHEHGADGHVMRLLWGESSEEYGSHGTDGKKVHARVELYVCFKLNQAALVVDGAVRDKRSIDGMSMRELEQMICLGEQCYEFVRRFNAPYSADGNGTNPTNYTNADVQDLSTDLTDQTDADYLEELYLAN